MNFISWILFGLIAGIIANIIDPEPSRGGALGAIVLGIIGAIVGGVIANLVFGVGISGFNLSSFAVAILGALIVLMAGKALRRAE